MTFVVSAGQLAAIERPMAMAAPRLQFADGVAQDYATVWRSQPQVRTVVSFLARNIAQLGLHTYRRKSDTDRERLTAHPLAQLLSKPNPRTTRYRLIDSLVNDLGIYDTALWLKVRPDDTSAPGALVRIPPQLVTPQGDNWLGADSYLITGSKGSLTVKASDVVHFRGHNPDDPRWGSSPIETLRRILDEERAAGLYRDQLWRNGARMSGYLTRPAATPWGDGARARFRAQWQAQYTGGGSQAGGTPILEDGMTFVPSSISPESAQYIEARKLTREEVAAAYHIPLPMVGILDNATFSNITEQHKQLYQDTLGPWLQMIREDIELQLLPDLDDTDGVYVEFNLAEKMRGSFEEQAQQLQTAVGAPWLSRNEARARQNLPQIPGGDDLVTPLNVLIGGQASPRDSAPSSGQLSGRVRVKARADETVEAKAVEVLSAFFARQAQVLASAAGAGALAWDDERWNAELGGDLFRVNALIATQAGRAAMESLGLDPDEWDADRTLGWLQANAVAVAESINETTRAEVEAAVDNDEDDDPAAAVQSLFKGVVAARALQIAVTQVAAISGFGTTEAVQQSGLTATKTWRVRSSRPRTAHARMDGETVPMSETFSNGGRWPGDSKLHPDQRSGCTCDIDVTVEV